jgi:N-acetylglucosamine-6-phosphate deacetylase
VTTVLSGASIVLADRLLTPGSIVIEGDRIAEVVPGARPVSGDGGLDLTDHVIVPGFIDVHVHGMEGYDVLDGPGGVAAIARRLPRYGVAAFCPTTVACPPAALADALQSIGAARIDRPVRGARVLPAHLESNFLNPQYRGAQPARCLRLPPTPSIRFGGADDASVAGAGEDAYAGQDLIATIEQAIADVGIVTLAPELPRALDLVARLASAGARVSLGHSGASYEEARAAMTAGARQATHLFNRMAPLRHRDPGLVGAVLAHDELAAEVICDGVHVHPAVIRATVKAKRPDRVMAITDATAAAALPPGSIAQLGGQPIVARDDAAYLEDGTLAGSTCTMDRAFRLLAGPAGLTIVEAAILCATTPARELGLHGHGLIEAGAVADLAVLGPDLQVVRTYVAGELVFES